jgi:hypothetical protein
VISHLSLSVSVSDHALVGTSHLTISTFTDDSEIQQMATVWHGVNILPTLTESQSHYQWAVTVLRETCDRAIAQLLEDMAAGKENPMLDRAKQKTS